VSAAVESAAGAAVVSATTGAGSATTAEESVDSEVSAFCPQETTATANPHTNKNAINFFMVYRFKISAANIALFIKTNEATYRNLFLLEY
jgi:hypothetical protein